MKRDSACAGRSFDSETGCCHWTRPPSVRGGSRVLNTPHPACLLRDQYSGIITASASGVKSVIHRWAQLWRSRLLVTEAAAWLIISLVALRTLPFRWLVLMPAVRPRPGANTSTTVQSVGAAVGKAAERLPMETLCLPRALAARAMLTWRRVPTTLHFGVNPLHGAVTAHVWLMAGPHPVIGTEIRGDFREFTPAAGDPPRVRS